jgi:LmbE family N-acetylglucosaminyl deacetylase
MKPTPNSQRDLAPLLAFGAHPDDIEFGCGGVVANETRRGQTAHFVVCSQGEAGTNGTLEERSQEAAKSAQILHASIEQASLGGDSRFKYSNAAVVLFAGVIRRVRPSIVLSPAPVENQHPDHFVLGQIVRDAARLARYGGVQTPGDHSPHAIDHLLYYAATVEGEPKHVPPVLLDVSDAETMRIWKEAMEAHASQMKTRNYVELQLTRARLNGFRAGVEYAIALFPSDPIVVDSLEHLGHGARRF